MISQRRIRFRLSCSVQSSRSGPSDDFGDVYGIHTSDDIECPGLPGLSTVTSSMLVRKGLPKENPQILE